jgi:hypothetical protein
MLFPVSAKLADVICISGPTHWLLSWIYLLTTNLDDREEIMRLAVFGSEKQFAEWPSTITGISLFFGLMS